MIFSTLSNDELERWIASAPWDLGAKIELLGRARFIMNTHTDTVEELSQQLDTLQSRSDALLESNRWLQDQLNGFLTV